MSRKPDAFVGKTGTGTLLVLRPDSNIQMWRDSGATLEPAFIQTAEDREVLEAAAAWLQDSMSIDAQALGHKLGDMIGEVK